MKKRFSLGKTERLKSRKQIDRLFAEGKSFSASPYRVLYIAEPALQPVLQMGVAVSGKNFKRAVDRNRVKRLTREAYRVQKNELKDLVLQQKKTLILFLIFTAKDLPEWAMVSAKVGVILKKMCGLLNEAIPPPVK